MNVSLTKELEQVVEGKVKSGLYNNSSEVIRDAIRRAFCATSMMNVEQDTPELAALIRDGMNSRHVPHKKGDARRILLKVRRELGQ